MKKLLCIFSILLFIISACSVTDKSINNKKGIVIIDETEHNKYCGCSPCECIGGCKCTKDYPFPGYERTK